MTVELLKINPGDSVLKNIKKYDGSKRALINSYRFAFNSFKEFLDVGSIGGLQKNLHNWSIIQRRDYYKSLKLRGEGGVSVEDNIKKALVLKYFGESESVSTTESNANKIDAGFRVVDEFLSDVKKNHLKGDSRFHSNNEASTMKDISTLAVISFDPNYDSTVRFEALRRLVLLDFALKINSDSQGAGKLNESFIHTVNDAELFHTSDDVKIGGAVLKKVLSVHDDNTNECFDFIIEPGGNGIDCPEGCVLKETNMKFRQYGAAGNLHDVFVHSRVKSPTGMMSKMLREVLIKGKSKLSFKMTDHVGNRYVVKNDNDIHKFVRHFQSKLSKFGFVVDPVEIKDTVNEEGFEGNSGGSSSKLKLFKFYLPYMGSEIEIQIMGLKSYFNYESEVGTEEDPGQAHSLYSLDRQFEVNQALFPASIYFEGENEEFVAEYWADLGKQSKQEVVGAIKSAKSALA